MADQNATTWPFPRLTFAEGSAPGTPDASEAVIYVKTDGKLYIKDDAGVETELGAPTFHGCKVWRSGTQTVNDATVTALEFDEEDYDTNGYHDVGSNPSRMTIPAGLGGKYLIMAMTGAHAASTNDDRIRFNVDAGTYLAQKRYGGLSGTLNLDLSVVAVLAEGSYVEVEVFWDGTTSTAYGDASDRRATCEFSITYLGA